MRPDAIVHFGWNAGTRWKRPACVERATQGRCAKAKYGSGQVKVVFGRFTCGHLDDAKSGISQQQHPADTIRGG